MQAVSSSGRFARTSPASIAAAEEECDTKNIDIARRLDHWDDIVVGDEIGGERAQLFAGIITEHGAAMKATRQDAQYMLAVFGVFLVCWYFVFVV